MSNMPATQWLKQRFTSLYESAPPPEEADFKALFLATFSENAQVVFNHEQVSVDTFQEKLTAANYAISRASVDWKELIEVPTEGRQSDSQEGIVAGVFIVTRSMKIRIRAGPAQRLNHNVFSAKIELDSSAQPDITGKKLRIMEFFVTSLDKAVPIHLPSAPNQPAEPSTIDPSLLEKGSK